tara:strand:- start:3345 stop:3488 length:144 start_codon:yes stop_codon:yes gene_type:complete
MAKKINIDDLLRDHSFYKSTLLEIYKTNKKINRKIRQYLEKSDLEDY